MQQGRRTWRVRGVPREFDKNRLTEVLLHHPTLQCADGDAARHGNEASVHTLAPDLRPDEQVATVRFGNIPSQLNQLGTGRQLVIEVPIRPENQPFGDQESGGSTILRTVQVAIDDHFDGITTLISPSTDEEHQVNVLAVSGLGSHPFGSFVNKDDGHMWLTDSLPRDMPSARIMIYGYRSGLQHSTSFVQLDDLAASLHIAISQLPEKEKPLILIGHSLGGLLIKEALILLSESDFASGLLDMISGILFFGVPNDGMNIESLVPLVNDQPNRFLLESLNFEKSQVLRRQKQEFAKVLSRMECRLCCFYETEQSPTAAKDPETGRYKMSGPIRCLVSEFSATSCMRAGVVPADRAVAIHRTHSDLVKFARYDTEYSNVAFVLKLIQHMPKTCRPRDRAGQHIQGTIQPQYGQSGSGLVIRQTEEAPAKQPTKRPADEAAIFPSSKRPLIERHHIEHRQSQAGGDPPLHSPPSRNGMEPFKQLLVDQLYFSKIDERLTHLTPAQGTTCRWFLAKPEYKSWHDFAKQPDHGGFLWIKGNPGTGKSTLMKFLFETAKIDHRDDRSEITLSFFFLARGAIEEKTTTGLYRSLLHQLFEKASDLQDSLEWMTADGAKVIQRDGWHEEALKQTLTHAVQRLGPRSMTIFVDALDECNEDQVASMIFFFEELCDRATETKVRLRICFSSRHYPTIAIQKGIEITLENTIGHTQDIQQFINSRLRVGTSKQAEQLRSEILEKSSGIFLWVVLVLDILNSHYPANPSIKKMHELLKDIPPELDELFNMILTRDGNNLERLQLCLQWILFAGRPLKPRELYFAIEFGCDTECSGYWDQADVALDDMDTFVRNSSKGLAEITRNKASEVQFIHESVRDFLMKDLQHRWSTESGNVIGHGHEVLRRCCFAQLNASFSQEDIPDPLPEASAFPGYGFKIQNTLLRFPLLEYAIHGVLHHANAAQANGIAQTHFIADFPLKRWILLNNALEPKHSRRHKNSARLLYIFAQENLANLIQIHPERKSCFDVGGERFVAPILAALASESYEAVRAFMRAQAETEPPWSPFRHLCHQYCQAKIRRKARLELAFPKKRDVAFLFWHTADEMIFFAFLVSSQGFGTRRSDSNSHSPLTHDRGKEYEYTLTVLLERGIELDSAAGGFGQMALAWAARWGHESIVKLMIGKGVEVNSTDFQGRTPLHHALKGHEGIVRLLLENGANIETKDDYGHTPLSWAASSAKEPIIKLLLEHSADIESKDNGGRTPLSWAVNNQEESIIKLLLEHGADIESKDRRGRTPLSWAASNPEESIIKLLLEHGADIESKDKDGRTPLSWAATDSEESIIKLLLEHGADIESKDKDGRTPLSWAVIYQVKSIIKLLLEHGADIDSKDKDGRTPLSWAASDPEESIIKLLLEHGADIESKDKNDRAPVHWAQARRTDNGKVTQLLQKRGGTLLDPGQL